jgi:excisionase family DNA binding protein
MSTRLTVAEAAEYLEVSPRRVRALAQSGQLPAERFGKSLAFRLTDLKRLKRLPAGRPPGSPNKSNR